MSVALLLRVVDAATGLLEMEEVEEAVTPGFAPAVPVLPPAGLGFRVRVRV